VLLPPQVQVLVQQQQQQQACCLVQQVHHLQEAQVGALAGQAEALEGRVAEVRSLLPTATPAAWPHGPYRCQTCFLCC
jgi:hypothetical protein